MLQREIKNKGFAERKNVIVRTVSDLGHNKIYESDTNSNSASSLFSCKINSEQPPNKNLVDLDKFFMPNLKPATVLGYGI